MSDELPESLRMRLYRKYVSMLTAKNTADKSGEPRENPEEVVWGRLSDDRAQELMTKLKALYPDIYKPLIQELYRLIKNNTLRELDGLTVYSIIRSLGLDIKPELRIKFVKDGKEVDMSEYLE